MHRVLFSILLTIASPAPAQDIDFFTLAAGDIGGNYFATARAICNVVNRADVGKLRCSPESTPGSVYNLDALASGQVDFAIVQSDWLETAEKGIGTFAQNGAMPDLVGVIALYQEQVTILVRKDSQIAGPKDLIGAIVDLGPPASGRRVTGERVLAALDVTLKQMKAVSELSSGAAIDELCDGKIDAIVLVTGHPDASVARALRDCSAELLPFGALDQATLAATGALYSRSSIPAASYGPDFVAVPTVAVTATLVTRNKPDSAAIPRAKAVLSAIRDNKVALVNRVPVLAGLNTAAPWPADMPIPAFPAGPASP